MSVLNIEFYLRFYTRPGQSLYISRSGSLLPMEYLNGEFWHARLALEEWPEEGINYSYVLRLEDGGMTEEWGNDRVLDQPAAGIEEIQVMDAWNWTGEYENVFYTSPFRNVLLKRKDKTRKSAKKAAFTHIFRVKAPLLKPEEVIALTGSGPALGEWDASEAVLMAQEGSWWTARLQVPKEALPIHYKYAVYNTKEKAISRYEQGENRYLHGDAHQHTLTVLHDGFVHLPNNTWRGAGVAIPVFSLRSKKSMGVGEFTDLKLLIDWAVKTDLRLVQILPINDTTANHDWHDSYPYAAISAFALHPMYLNLEKAAGKKHAAVIRRLKKKQKELNDLPELDYEEVMKVKWLAAKEIYEASKVEFEKDAEYQTFFQQNKHWLVPYAAFSYLRDKNGTPDFSKWKTHSKYDQAAIEQLVARGTRHYNAIVLYYFIQYHLHLQLREAADYAHEQGVIVKGDIAIGIYRYSCDAWMAPHLYHMDQQAGAPPDNFAVKGQNWGFPTYSWEEMEKDGFSWWKQRFAQMSSYFDGFRIDHILGFFRIWSIPMNAVQGILGHFVPAIPVYRVEFDQRGIWFDHSRYTQPFINDAVLWEVFATDSDHVKSSFLHARDGGFYQLRDDFNTQRKVEAWFAGQEPSELNARMRDGLYELISNIILIDVEGREGQEFHFRITMDQTSSFRYLEWHTQQQLLDLYNNYFFNRQDQFWQKEAMKKLPALKRATNMLVFGEDLGMVPRCVPSVMRELGILSLEIQRMPKNPAREFFHPNEAPYLSVVTPATHDMSTIRGWWEEDRALTQRFFNRELGQWGEAPYFCEPWVNRAIVLQHLHSPAQWSIFQLQDILGMSDQLRRENPHDERINVPANPNHYWRYRMHLTLEELIKEKEFNAELREYVEQSGR